MKQKPRAWNFLKGPLLYYVVTLVAGLALSPDLGARAQGLPPDQGPGGPILVVTSSSNPFSGYYAEILRAEGLNAFATADISIISASTLSAYDVVILAEMPLTSAQVSILSNWVNGGGNLIAMRPNKQLASLLGLSDASSTLANAYLLVNTASGPGVGIVNQTIQFHGTADLYSLNGARALATLYSNASTANPFPAVTLASVGANGGQAAAFTYDLARSIVYTRQGNPVWSGQERDDLPPIRPNDLFFGAASFDPQPDWIDLSKVDIPQADEQQRLLVNLILAMNSQKKPLPRFWYFPNGKKAVIIMTGDDHGSGGTAGRFDIYRANSPFGCSVANWECIRSTSYTYTSTPLSNAQAAAYNTDGFEIALHVLTNCGDFTPSSLESFYSSQLRDFQTKYTSLPAPSTIRTHCGPWSDYATQPPVEVNHGIRFDTNYYYWPGSWINNRPGMFTGSGMPMRFADANGNIIDVYQATTQMTDESQQSYPFTVNTLLDNALGPVGFYGAFTVNAHTDFSFSDVSNSVVDAALARGVPIVSSRQMLTWLDGRNASSFGGLTWDGQNLTFNITVGNGAGGLLQAMVPTSSPAGTLGQITRNATPIAYTTQTIKGIGYAFFPAVAGAYRARFTAASPVISNVRVTGITATGATITWATDVPADSQVDFGLTPAYESQTQLDSSLVTAHVASISGLSPATTYNFRVRSAAGGTLSLSGNFALTTSASSPPVAITFDEPVPPGASGDLLNGLFQGIDFGAGQWRWETGLDVDSTNHIFFDSSAGTSRSFTFSPAPKILNSIRVFNVSAIPGSMQVVTTGWTQASTTVTVSFTSGWDWGVDDINYDNGPWDGGLGWTRRGLTVCTEANVGPRLPY